LGERETGSLEGKETFQKALFELGNERFGETKLSCIEKAALFGRRVGNGPGRSLRSYVCFTGYGCKLGLKKRVERVRIHHRGENWEGPCDHCVPRPAQAQKKTSRKLKGEGRGPD